MLVQILLILSIIPKLNSSQNTNLNKAVFIEDCGHLIPQSNAISFLVPIKIHIFDNIINNVSWQVNRYLKDFKNLMPIKHFDSKEFQDFDDLNNTKATQFQKVVRFAVRILVKNALKNSKNAESQLIINLTTFMHEKFAEAKTDLSSSLKEVRVKFSKLKSLFKAFHTKKRKGLINAVGSLGKVLFGFATNEDVEGLEKEIKTKNDLKERFLKINKKLIQIVDVQSLKIGNISEHFDSLNSAVLALADDFSDLTRSQSMQGYYILEQLISIISERFTRRVKDLFINIGASIDEFINQISLSNLGNLPPSLLGPNELRNLIDATRMQLPAHLRLVNFKSVRDILLLYKILRTEILEINQHYFIAIHIPLVDEKNRIEIFRVHTIPIPLSENSNVTVEIMVPKNNILGIAADRKATISFPENILKNCLKFRDFHFCNLQYPLEKNSKYSRCILELKTQDSNYKSCDRKLVYLKGEKQNTMIALGSRSWVYYFPRTQDCKLTCYQYKDGDLFPNFKIVNLNRVGIIKLLPNCQLDCKNYFLADSLHVDSRNVWVNHTFQWEHFVLNGSYLRTLPWSTLKIDHLQDSPELSNVKKELVGISKNEFLDPNEHGQLQYLLKGIEKIENANLSYWSFEPDFHSNYLDFIICFCLFIYGIFILIFITALIKIKKSFTIISENLADIKLKLGRNEKKKNTASTSAFLQKSTISLLEGESLL